MPARNSPVLAGAKVYDVALQEAGGTLVDTAAASNGTQLCVALYRSPPYDLSVTSMTVPRLSINLRSVAVSGGVAGERRRDYAGRRYSMFFTPAYAEARWRKMEGSRHLNLYFQPRTLEEAADGGHSVLLDQPLMDLHQPSTRPFIDALERTIVRQESFAHDATTSLALLILAGLVQRADRRTPTLTPSAMAHVHEYVETHLDSPLRVADLAAAAGMAPSCFASAFNAASGMPPHRFVLAQRLARAMQLLQASRLELSEVALACGFSSQQHMTTTMQRVFGTTPGRARRVAYHTAQAA